MERGRLSSSPTRRSRRCSRRRGLRPDRARRAIAVRDGRIAWVGRDRGAGGAGLPARDLGGRLVTPGADRLPHPHRLRRRPGARVRDAARRRELRGDGARRRRHRLDGARDTRDAGRRRCWRRALPRVDALIAEGVATLEIKSGYGLDRETELRMLRVARGDRASAAGAGARRASSARTRCRRVRGDRRRLHRRGLHPDAARGPRPRGWSTRSTASARASPSRPAQIARVFDAARELGPAGEAPRRAALQPRRRAAGGASSAALSADHLEYLDEAGVARDGGGGHRRGAPAGRLLHAARDAGAADRGAARRRRADGGGDRLQPRLLADGLAAAGDEHGLHAVPPDAGGGAGRGDARGGAGARARRLRA